MHLAVECSMPVQRAAGSQARHTILATALTASSCELNSSINSTILLQSSPLQQLLCTIFQGPSSSLPRILIRQCMPATTTAYIAGEASPKVITCRVQQAVAHAHHAQQSFGPIWRELHSLPETTQAREQIHTRHSITEIYVFEGTALRICVTNVDFGHSGQPN